MLLRSLLISAFAASVSAQPSGNSQSCPVVEPEEICPSTKPAGGESCNVDEGTVCRYDFELLGCNPGELECTPVSVFDCQNGIWVKGASTPLRCLSSGLPCPKIKPENRAPCLDHDSGLFCEYEFVNRSCEEGGEICAATETYVCAGTVWASAVSNYFCNDPNAVPSHFLDPCDPNEKCPSIKPENGAPCPQQGLSCDYEYGNTSCDEGEEKCSPTEFYSCSADGWIVAMPSFFCDNANFPSHFLDTCDPNNKPCPKIKPENGAPCVQAGHQPGLSCDYEYANTSCDEGDENCTPTEFYTCFEDGWAVAMPGYFCENANFPSHFLDACDPNNKPCPKTKPENGAPCLEDGHQEGLSCDYEYRNTSCEEGEENCTPTEFYSCSGAGWMVAMPGYFCETFPSHMLEACDPNKKECPQMKPENGAPCTEEGMSCDYEYRNTSCDESTENCSPTEYFNCSSGRWNLIMPRFGCPDGVPTNFFESCDPIAEISNPGAASDSSEADAASDSSEDLTRDPGSASSIVSSGAATLQRASQNGHWIVGAAIVVSRLLH